MTEKTHFVVFTLDNQKFALPLASVEKIARAVAVRPLPKASEMVLGVINIQGRIIPVLDLKIRFGIPSRPIAVTDHLIIAMTPTGTLALLVDSVQDIIESDRQNITDQSAIPGRMEYVKGVIRLESGMVLINDLDHLLSADEAEALDQALQKNTKRRQKTESNSQSTKAAE